MHPLNFQIVDLLANMSLITPIFMFNSIENKGGMTFKSNVCKAWFAPYSEVQIGFRTVGRMLVV